MPKALKWGMLRHCTLIFLNIMIRTYVIDFQYAPFTYLFSLFLSEYNTPLKIYGVCICLFVCLFLSLFVSSELIRYFFLKRILHCDFERGFFLPHVALFSFYKMHFKRT